MTRLAPLSPRTHWTLLSAVCIATLGVACSAQPGSTSGSNSNGLEVGDPSEIDLGSGTGGVTGSSGKPPAQIEETLPVGFTPSDSSQTAGAAGGYKLVGPVADFQEEAANSCRNVLRGIVRDFEPSHADFGGPKGGAKGLVGALVGSDRKPTPSNNNAYVASALSDWYTNNAGGNVPYVVDFWLAPQGDGSFVFDSSRFFPVDTVGTTSGNDDDGVPRNFAFTTEIHTAFEYKGGEVFSFRGDDDVFVFIHGVLAVDLGGIHLPESATVSLDTFAATNGLVVGEVYTLDLFHAERNPTGSNFRIDTTLDFKECAILENDLIVK